MRRDSRHSGQDSKTRLAHEAACSFCKAPDSHLSRLSPGHVRAVLWLPSSMGCPGCCISPANPSNACSRKAVLQTRSVLPMHTHSSVPSHITQTLNICCTLLFLLRGFSQQPAQAVGLCCHFPASPEPQKSHIEGSVIPHPLVFFPDSKQMVWLRVWVEPGDEVRAPASELLLPSSTGEMLGGFQPTKP